MIVFYLNFRIGIELMKLRERIQTALKQEKGIRLTAADVQALASLHNIGFPAKRQYRRKPSPSKEPMKARVNFLIQNDLERLVEIESAVTGDAWTGDEYLRQAAIPGVYCRVIRLPDQGRGRKKRMGEPVGAIVYDHQPKQSWVEVQRIVVDPKYQLRSFGRQLIASLHTFLLSTRMTHIEMHVDESNLSMLLFLRAVGFTALDVSHGEVLMSYYWDSHPRPFHEPELDPPRQREEHDWKSSIYDDGESGDAKV